MVCITNLTNADTTNLKIKTMKTKLQSLFLVLALLAGVHQAAAQGTAFMYQGRLNANGGPANGSYDLAFRLFATNITGTIIAGPVTNSATAVTNGLFTVTIDFGPGVFTGGSNWLEIAVSTNAANNFTTLAPRQQLTPVPYAIFAGTASNVSGTVSSAQLPASPTLAGTVTAAAFTGNGANVTNVNATALNGLAATNFWQLGGNNVAGGQFLGSTNNQPLEIRVGGVRAGWISQTNGTANIVLGPAQNVISNGTIAASILGGSNNVIGVAASYSLLGGGTGNSIQTNAYNSVLGGGQGNSIQSGAYASVLGGGNLNSIQTNAYRAFLGGGYNNSIQALADESVIVGGNGNSIQYNSFDNFIGGGMNNSMVGGAEDSFIGGGYGNSITGAVWSVIGGGEQNAIAASAGNAFIGSGQNNTIQSAAAWSFIGAGYNNKIYGPDSVLGGGYGNSILSSGNPYVFLGGGNNNTIQAGPYAFLGGGSNNNLTNGYGCFLGGGFNNSIQTCYYSFLGGGQGNTILQSSDYTFLGGGNGNNIGTTAIGSTIPGGQNNAVGNNATNAFAAGYRAKANHSGTFVWSDSEPSDFASTSTNQFNVRANGGVRFVTAGAGMTLDGQSILTGSSSVLSAVVTNNQTGVTLSGTFSGNGSGLTGVTAQLPATVVTNNEPIVILGSLFLQNALALPATAKISAGGSTMLYSDANNNSSFGEYANYGGGNNNTAVGAAALESTSGNNNVAVGYNALQIDSTGHNNTANGYQALNSNLDGNANVAQGVDALQNEASGFYNTAVGGFALQNLQSGNLNVVLGYNAGNSLINGTNNVYISNIGNPAESSVIRIGDVQTKTFIAGVIQAPSVTTITITGGADLAEPFPISTTEQKVSEGAVVVIDEANPGQLKLTDRPYDTRVAGVISGANGIHPGIQMHQQGLLEGGKNVALTGRVYVQADASNGAIKPGDLLTTSSTPGRAMKVSDHVRAQGAILGKAMTGLLEGKGMVLVLVTLQ